MKTRYVNTCRNVFIDISPNSFLRGLSSFTAQMGVLAKFFNLDFYVTSLNVLVKPKRGLTREYLSFFLKMFQKLQLEKAIRLNIWKILNLEIN